MLGPSGCGKSTLLAAIAGFLEPDRAAASSWTASRSTGPGAERGVVFQEYALLPWMNVLDNAALGLKLRGMPRERALRDGAPFLALANLHGVEHKYPHELSGGMKQRVAVARTLANAPEVMLMDEPFAAVDAQTRMTLQEELARIATRSQLTVVFITHSVEEAIFLGDRVAVMTPGPGRIRTIVDVPFARDDARVGARSTPIPRSRALREQLLELVRLRARADAPAPHDAAHPARSRPRVIVAVARWPGGLAALGSRRERKLAPLAPLARRAATTGSRSTSRPSASTSCGCRKPAGWSRCAAAPCS